MNNDLPRIAAQFAPQPFRLLAQNAPMVWSNGELKIQLAQEKINMGMCENLFNEQAPILYADDLIKMAKAEGREVIDVHEMMKVPMAMPPFDQMIIEAYMADVVGKVHQSAGINSGTQLTSLAGYVKLSPFEEKTAEALRWFIKLHATKGRLDDASDMLENSGRDDTVKELDRITKLTSVPKFLFRAGMIDEKSIDVIDTAQFVGIYTYALCPNPKRPGEHECVGALGVSVYMVDPNNGMVLNRSGAPFNFRLLPHESDEEIYLEDSTQDFVDDCVETTTAICLQAIAMLNCSNVVLVETGKTTDGTTKKQRKQMRMRSLKHHELRVKVGKQLIPVSGRKGLSGTKGLHMVRGHFRDYSRGSGLFGHLRYSSIWVPPHARGSAENGVVMKDYRLDTSDQQVASS